MLDILKTQLIWGTMCFSILFLMAASCKAEGKYRAGGPYYYESFANYEIPFRPIGELTSEEAKVRDSYYIAYFDNDGKIVSFTKYLYGKFEFSDKYIYRSNGVLERREMTKSTGDIEIQYFDKKGKIIEK